MSSEVYKARLMLIWLAIIAHVMIYGLTAAVGMRLNLHSLLPFIVWLVVILVFTSVYCRWRNMTGLRNIVEPTLIGMLLSVTILISTYLAMLPSLPLADSALSKMDSAVGFDWRVFVIFVDNVPLLATFLNMAYQSFPVQLFALPALLGGVGHAKRAYWMVSSYTLIGLSASFIAIWFPAIGAFPYNEVQPEQLKNIDAFFGYFFLEQFHGVRDNPNFVFDLNNGAGIITFPSVHAAVAVLCAWAVWNVRFLRYPIFILNVGMAVSAITHGSHYLVDVIAGIVLAGLCIALASGLTRLVPVREVHSHVALAPGRDLAA